MQTIAENMTRLIEEPMAHFSFLGIASLEIILQGRYARIKSAKAVQTQLPMWIHMIVLRGTQVLCERTTFMF